MTIQDYIDKFWVWTWRQGNFGCAIRILLQRTTSQDLRQYTTPEIVEEMRSAGKLAYHSTLWAVLLAAFGVGMTICDNELAYNATMLNCPYSHDDITLTENFRPIMAGKLDPSFQALCKPSSYLDYKFKYGYIIRVAQTGSTILLCFMLTIYYNTQIRSRYLRSNEFLRADNEQIPFIFETSESWWYFFELFLNALHSPPGASFSYTYIDNSKTGAVTYDIETLMFVAMSSRMYWFVRLLREHCWFHTKSFTVELLTKMNNIKLDTHFAIKLYMDQYPFTILLFSMGTLLLWTSYCSRICDRPAQGTLQVYMWDSIWMQIITIATVGFGDFYPITTCSRFAGFIAMSGGITASALLVTLFSKKIGFTPQEFRLFLLTSRAIMNADRKKSAVICMQRMFRAQKSKSETQQHSVGLVGCFSNLFNGWSKLPPKGDRASVRAWVTQDWAHSRMRYKATANIQPNTDSMEQASTVFEELTESVNALQTSCLANNETYMTCQHQLHKSDESLQKISAMITTLENMLQAPQSPEKKGE